MGFSLLRNVREWRWKRKYQHTPIEEKIARGWVKPSDWIDHDKRTEQRIVRLIHSIAKYRAKGNWTKVFELRRTLEGLMKDGCNR